MSNECALRLRFCATVTILAWANCGQFAAAQTTGWKAAPKGMLPLVGAESLSSAPMTPATNQPAMPAPRAPLARLIANPDQTEGAPPFALTDQAGTVQRYVEPVPGIDLAPYVGEIVVVRHDTGPTLLASQLELPRRRLYPMVGEPPRPQNGAMNGWPGPSSGRSGNFGGVEQAQYVDNDDASVQLLPDDMSLPQPMPGRPGGVVPLEMLGPGGSYPGQMMPGPMYGPGFGPQYCDPMQCGPPMPYGPGIMPPYAGAMVAPCPQCGQYHGNAGCGPSTCSGPSSSKPDRKGLQISGDIDFLLFRTHINEDVVGKQSEEYQFSPRFILGFRNLGNLEGRVRYWLYERDTHLLGGDSIRLEFNVLDIEATHRFEGRRSELTLAAGLRLADIQLIDDEEEECGTDIMGLTMAADGLTPLVCIPGGYFGWVYGGRVSLLGGDWGGDDNSVFINEQFRDDNWLVTELYVGTEVACRWRNVTIGGRLFFEMQNWRSDALASEADVESIGFLGPGLQIGADF